MYASWITDFVGKPTLQWHDDDRTLLFSLTSPSKQQQWFTKSANLRMASRTHFYIEDMFQEGLKWSAYNCNKILVLLAMIFRLCGSHCGLKFTVSCEVSKLHSSMKSSLREITGMSDIGVWNVPRIEESASKAWQYSFSHTQTCTAMHLVTSESWPPLWTIWNISAASITSATTAAAAITKTQTTTTTTTTTTSSTKVSLSKQETPQPEASVAKASLSLSKRKQQLEASVVKKPTPGSIVRDENDAAEVRALGRIETKEMTHQSYDKIICAGIAPLKFNRSGLRCDFWDHIRVLHFFEVAQGGKISLGEVHISDLQEKDGHPFENRKSPGPITFTIKNWLLSKAPLLALYKPILGFIQNYCTSVQTCLNNKFKPTALEHTAIVRHSISESHEVSPSLDVAALVQFLQSNGVQLEGYELDDL